MLLDLESLAGARSQFDGDAVVPGFAHVTSFLAAPVYQRLCTEVAAKAEFRTWSIGLGPDGAVAGAFAEPVEGRAYGSIRGRNIAAIPFVDELAAALAEPDHVRGLGEAIGLPLRELAHCEDLASWGPGSFTGAHTDLEPDDPMTVVVNLSLTDGWKPEYGGETCYWNRDSDALVRVLPTPNGAAMFRPTDRSYHWVEPVGETAPDGVRIGWALAYR